MTAIALPRAEKQSAETYDLSGRRADEAARGVLVMAGKKVVK